MRPFLYSLGLGLCLSLQAHAQPGASAFVEVHPALRGEPLPSRFADTLDRFGSNWRALRVPLSTGQAYAQVPAFFTLGLQAWYGPNFEIYARFPLRKDLEAWYQEGVHSNVAKSPDQLDLNVPNEAWGRWTNPLGFLMLGRFSPDLGPSPNSVVLGGAPRHDGLWWHLEASKARYDLVISSLDPWLAGTPDSPGGEPPLGSEAWQQQNYVVPNQRLRTFAEPSKTLLLHRVGLDFSHGWIALVEQALIGGKDLALRDMSPFIAWHNNFGDGYTKASTTAELGLRPASTSTFYFQLDMEDIESPVGETSGETNPTTLGALAGYRQTIPLGPYGHLTSRLDAVYTDPVFNNHRLPLQKMTSRRLYRSNYRAQEDEDFADIYVVDYPLGYRRGPDAIDLWWNLDYQNAERTRGASLELAWLRQGACSLESPYDSCSVFDHALSGIVERQWKGDLSLWWQARPELLLYLGGGARSYANLEHIRSEDGVDGWARAGLRYTLGKDRHPQAP